MSTLEDRAVGCFLGLAVGDALGTTLEFRSPGTFEPISDMVGGGPFRLKAGQWTDDTSMALCLAESLLENGWDPSDQMERYCRWREHGENSSTGVCFDIGNTVHDALETFKTSREAFSGSTYAKSAGNGSLMRLAPIPLFYRKDLLDALEKATEMSRTTHGARTCLDACRVATKILISLLQGIEKQQALESAETVKDLCPEVLEIVKGSYRDRHPPEIQGTGYVVKSLEAALWAFHQSENFKEGALLAVNLGDDADTTGAIYGQFAGAAYGASMIPSAWLQKLHHCERIQTIAQNLFLASCEIP